MHLHKWMALLFLAVASPLMAAGSDAANDITQMMKHTWERPDAPLQVDPVTVESDYAVAGWTQGKRGGRALLQRVEGQWRVVLCAGDALRKAETLRRAGLSAQEADSLSQAIARSESSIAPERLKQFALFQGTQRMDGHPHPADH
ncbi:copper uptake system-associated protein [Pseudomonas sp. PDM22]|uniref:copper uptake system-associated protein n=1 Tax=Pseudomonas sp. PDM22 TaxID=2769287 RepID=UPI0017863BD0|nr:copper uptake system-associated protein [Pseudomonas sp. PDM22]MBD9513654.1 copper uptake system-associated protein [Pseudomonas sp. PDM22]